MKEISVKAYEMTVSEFLKNVLDKNITNDTQISYEGMYYTFYIESFKFINNTNGTGLIIKSVLDDKIEVFLNEQSR